MIKIILITNFLLSAILSSSAFAENADDIVKYRINIMKSLGNHISIIAANLKGKVSINEDILPHSQSMLLTLSSINIEKTKDLVKAAESGNNQNIAKSLGALGKSCGACHDKFRKKKN